MADHSRNILFCGNPGAGKSTLLNSLAGDKYFRAGVAIGRGLTFQFDCKTGRDGLTYMDTPGLSDVKMRQQAAEAIAKALRSGGKTRLFFVCTLESGRFKPDDLTTIRLVTAACKDIHDYGLVINKVPEKTAKRLQDPSTMDSLLDLIFSDPHIPRTKRVFVNTLDQNLVDEDDVFAPASLDFSKFVQSVQDNYLRPDKVEEINVNEYEELKEVAAAAEAEVNQKKAELAMQREALEKQEHEFKKVQEQILQERADAANRLAAEKQALEAKAAREKAEAEKASNDLLERERKRAGDEAYEAKQKADAEVARVKQEKADADRKLKEKLAEMEREAEEKLAEMEREAQKKLDEQLERTRKMEEEEQKRKEELENERQARQEDRDQNVQLQKREEENDRLKIHGFYVNCRVQAVGDVYWVCNGEKLCDSGHDGILKSDGGDNNGTPRGSVDWKCGKTSRHPYRALKKC